MSTVFRGRRWKKRAVDLLAENRRETGRLKVAEVARKVGKTPKSVYRLLAELREEYSRLSA